MSGKLVAFAAVVFFTGLAEICFFTFHHAVQPLPTPASLAEQQAPGAVVQVADISAAKDTKELPAGILPEQGDHIAVFQEAEDGLTIGIDEESWKLDNDIAKFLVVIRPPMGATFDSGDIISQAVVAQEIDCKNKTFKTDYSLILSGTKILQYKPGTEPRPIKSGTTGAHLMETLCRPPDGTPVAPPAPKKAVHPPAVQI